MNKQALNLSALLCLSCPILSAALAAPGPHSALIKAKPSTGPELSPLNVPRAPALIYKRLEQIEALLMKPEARPGDDQKKALDRELTALTWAIEKSAAGAKPDQKLRTLHSYAFYVRGVLHFEMKDMAASMRFLECALKDDPKNAKAYEQRGTIRVFSGQARESLEDFDKAIKNGLNSDFAYINRGSMYVSTGQFDKAVDDLSLALSKRKNTAGAWMPLMLRARAQAGLKNYSAARQDAKDMLALASAPKSVQSDMQSLLAALDAKADQKATPPADKPFQADRTSLDTLIAPYIETARQTLPAAKERFLKGLTAREWMSVTTRIYGPDTDPGTVRAMEQVFVSVKSWQGSAIEGVLASPVHLPNHIQGETISVEEKDVLDWTIVLADGSEEGNVVGKFMESPEAKAALANPPGDKANHSNQTPNSSLPPSASPQESSAAPALPTDSAAPASDKTTQTPPNQAAPSQMQALPPAAAPTSK